MGETVRPCQIEVVTELSLARLIGLTRRACRSARNLFFPTSLFDSLGGRRRPVERVRR